MRKCVSKLLFMLAIMVLVLSSSIDVMAADAQKITKLQIGQWNGSKFKTVSKTELYVNGESAAVTPELAGAALAKKPETIVLDVNALIGNKKGGEYVVTSSDRSVAKVVRLSHDINSANYYKIQITAANKTGKAVIQVYDKYNLKKTAKLTVTVKALVEEINFGSNVSRCDNGELQMIVAKKGKLSLGATVNANATNKKLKFTVVEEYIGSAGNFSSTPSKKGSVISVNAKGLVTGKNNGYALVKVSAQDQKYLNGKKSVKTGVSELIKVYVQDSVVGSVVLVNPGKNDKGAIDVIHMKSNIASDTRTFQLVAEAYDSKGNRCDSKFLTYTSGKSSVAKVDADGRITAVGKGTTKINIVPADGSKLKKAVSVTVMVTTDAEQIYLPSDDITVLTGKTYKLKASVDKNASNQKLEYLKPMCMAEDGSSGDTITVSSSGVVKGLRPGKAVFAVQSKDGAVSRNVRVTVLDPIQSITASVPAYKGSTENSKSTTLYLNANQGNTLADCTIQASIRSAGGRSYQLSDGKVKLSSDKPSVATVDKNGVITAVGKGSAVITLAATDGSNKKATLKVKVVQMVDSIHVNGVTGDVMYIADNSTVQLKATTNANASNKRVVYSFVPESSYESKVTLKGSKLIVKDAVAEGNVKVGTLTVQAKDGTKTPAQEAFCTKLAIYVASEKKYVTNEMLNFRQGYSVKKGETSDALLSAINIPDDVTERVLTWKSDNTKVVAVDQTGVLTAKKEGIATITVADKAGKAQASTKVRVGCSQADYKLGMNEEMKLFIHSEELLGIGVNPKFDEENEEIGIELIDVISGAGEDRTVKDKVKDVFTVFFHAFHNPGLKTIELYDKGDDVIWSIRKEDGRLRVYKGSEQIADNQESELSATVAAFTEALCQEDVTKDDWNGKSFLLKMEKEDTENNFDSLYYMVDYDITFSVKSVYDLKAIDATIDAAILACVKTQNTQNAKEEKLFYEAECNRVEVAFADGSKAVSNLSASGLGEVLQLAFSEKPASALIKVNDTSTQLDVNNITKEKLAEAIIVDGDVLLSDLVGRQVKLTVYYDLAKMESLSYTVVFTEKVEIPGESPDEGTGDGADDSGETPGEGTGDGADDPGETPGEGTGDGADDSGEKPGEGTGDGADDPGETPGEGTGDGADDSGEKPGEGTGDGADDSGEKPGEGTGDGADDSGETPGENTELNMELIFTKGDSWANGMVYNIAIKNLSSESVSGWEATVTVPADTVLNDCWNCNCTVSGTTMTLSGIPVNDNYDTSVVPGNSTVDGMGISINTSSAQPIGEYIIKVGDSSAGSGSGGESGGESGGTTPSPEDPEEEIEPEVGSPFENHGKLSVSGTQLVDKNGDPYRLCGVSTHGLAWFPQYVNKDTFQYFRDDWGVNVVRLAMYTDEYGGYLNGGNQQQLETLIDNGVKYASELGMYVIIDWHILAANPSNYTEQAKVFFEKMTSRYANYDNIIYEICNEPTNSDWQSVIKPYAEEVLDTIRTYNEDAIVLVGTNTWSQDVDAVVGNKIDDPNVMYVAHFYAATHTESYRNKVLTAISGGVPVFISECSVVDASGNGAIGEDSAKAWFDMLEANNISYVVWNVSNKAETSSLISSSCNKLSGFTEDELSITGKWFRTRIRSDRGLD